LLKVKSACKRYFSCVYII